MRIPALFRILAATLGLLAGCGHSSNAYYQITVTVNPPAPSLTAGATQVFMASAAGSSQGVTWSVQESGGGSVTSAGVYTAPDTLGTYHVIATSLENSEKSGVATVTVVSGPAIASFSASPSPFLAGAGVTLQAVFSGGTGSISPGGLAMVSGQPVTVHPSQDTTYTLTVTGSSTTATASASVSLAVAPAIQGFQASSVSVLLGDSLTLTPTFSAGTGSISPAVGAVVSAADYPVSPTATTTYVLTVTGDLGLQVTQQVQVTVVAPLAISAFAASPATSYPGAGVALQPVFAGGSGVISPGVGTVLSGQSYPVAPFTSTTYTLTVTDALGSQKQASTQVLVRAHGSFSDTGPVGTPRRNHTATRLQDGSVLVVGGLPVAEGSPAYTVLNEAERYDPDHGQFSPVGTLNQARTGHAAVLLDDGKVLITGGNRAWSSDLAGTPIPATASAELWDPATGQFTLLAATMTVARRHHTATLLDNGQVLICGGLIGAAAGFADIQASAELYDPATKTFTALPAMTAARQQHQALLLPDQTVLILGGVAYDSLLAPFGIARAELFTRTGTPPFQATTTSLSTGRGLAGATLMSGGRVLVAGGLGPAGTWLQSTELFSPSGKSFSLSAPLAQAMAYPVAALLSGDRVALIAMGDTEVFDLGNAAVASVPGAGLPALNGLTATALANGKVLVVNLEGAKLFDPANP